MAASYKVNFFPRMPVKAQLFHVPGSAFEGGLTSGGARISSPEPGGRAMLEMQLAFQVKEWENPLSSWLMSKIDGSIFRVQLTRTPQLANPFNLNQNANSVRWAATGIMPLSNWDNGKPWMADGFMLTSAAAALEGVTTVQVDMTGYTQFLRPGHVIGIRNSTYLIDEIEYAGDTATIVIKPPLRKPLASGDLVFLQPYFTGSISNGDELRVAYDSANVGHIQPGRIVFSEVIL